MSPARQTPQADTPLGRHPPPPSGRWPLQQTVCILLECILLFTFPFAVQLHNVTSSLPAATKLGQGDIFTSVCQEFCPWGICLCACWHIPLPAPDPLDQTSPPQTRPSPWDQTPQPDQTPPTRQPPGPDPPPEADCSIRSTSGWYASYWNAFLYLLFLVALIQSS